MLSFSKLWKEFPPKKEWAMHREADSPVCFPCCNAVLMPLFPGAQAFWPCVDPAVQFSATLVPASFSLHQPFSLPLILPHLPLTSIFFSVVASLGLRAEINCSSAEEHILSRVGTCHPILCPGAGEEGFSPLYQG